MDRSEYSCAATIARSIRLLGTCIAALGLGCSPSHDEKDAGAPASGYDAASLPGFAWAEAAPCPLARFEANGVVVHGELWVLGGFTSSSLEVTRRVDIYDPAADSWRSGPDLPGAETHIGVVPVGDDIVVFGGLMGAFPNGERPPTTAEAWRWNAAASRWDQEPPLPTAESAFAWALLGTELHAAGGLGPDSNTDTDAHYVLDLAEGGAWTTAAPLPNARNHGGGAAAGGLFYAIAGRHDWDELSSDVPNVDAFDPASGAWTSRAPIPVARSEIAAATSAMEDGRILVVGGSLTGIIPSADIFVYDPSSNAWSGFPPLPEPRKGAVAVRIGPRIVVTTGSPTSVDPSATTFVGCCL